MPNILLLMIGCWSFLILICELILEAAHMFGGAMVVERFDDGVQMKVGAVQMIRICDVLMSLVGGVRMIRIGVGRTNVVGVALMILVFGARILAVDWPIL
jgi:hypothetical protein